MCLDETVVNLHFINEVIFHHMCTISTDTYELFDTICIPKYVFYCI